MHDDGTNLLFDVWLVSRATTGLLDAALAPTGLDADEFGVYSVLAAVDHITPTELARWMAAPPTTVSSYVKRFEARGHVARDPNPEDRRSYRLRLTPKGRAVHAEAGKRFLPLLREVVAALEKPERDVAAGMLALRTAIDRVRGASGAPEVSPRAPSRR